MSARPFALAGALAALGLAATVVTLPAPVGAGPTVATPTPTATVTLDSKSWAAATTHTCVAALAVYEDRTWTGPTLTYDGRIVLRRWDLHLSTVGFPPRVKVGNGPIVDCAVLLAGVQ